MGKIAGDIVKVAKYVLSDKRVSFRYQDVGHGEGSIIWWVGNDGKVQTFRSTGSETHHELNRRMDMDTRWRGRLEPDTGLATMLPPVRLYSMEPEEIPLPDDVMRKLEKLGAKHILLDTQRGLKRVSRRR